jgi:hypothetical protein
VGRLTAADLAELDRIVNLQQDGRSTDALSIVRGNIGSDLMADLRGMISTNAPTSRISWRRGCKSYSGSKPSPWECPSPAPRLQRS